MAANPYQVITDRVVSMLEEGVAPWDKPWTPVDAPRSLATGKPYQGINALMLSWYGMEYQSPYWATYRRISNEGGQVRRGEKGSPVILWKVIEKKVAGEDEPRRIPFLRYYSVFNLDQCDGIEGPELEEQPEFVPIECAEKVVRGYLDNGGPSFDHAGGDRAFYVPATDHVSLPRWESFTDAPAAYSVAFHELTHSTGHETRLKRFSGENGSFGSDPYAREELVAELGALYLCSDCGIERETVERSAAYLQSWAARLGREPKLIIQASSAAMKAAKLIRHEEGEES